jgi:hypothetical protein
MSADVLRQAAAQIRNDRGGVVSRHTQDGRRWLPVADLLDVMADRADEIESTFPVGSASRLETIARNTIDGWNEALAVARAYVGSES